MEARVIAVFDEFVRATELLQGCYPTRLQEANTLLQEGCRSRIKEVLRSAAAVEAAVVEPVPVAADPAVSMLIELASSPPRDVSPSVEAAPVEAVPVEAVPVEAAPPLEAVPVEAAPPLEAVPVEAAPVEAAPVEAAPVEAAPVEAVSSTAVPKKRCREERDSKEAAISNNSDSSADDDDDSDDSSDTAYADDDSDDELEIFEVDDDDEKEPKRPRMVALAPPPPPEAAAPRPPPPAAVSSSIPPFAAANFDFSLWPPPGNTAATPIPAIFANAVMELPDHPGQPYIWFGEALLKDLRMCFTRLGIRDSFQRCGVDMRAEIIRTTLNCRKFSRALTLDGTAPHSERYSRVRVLPKDYRDVFRGMLRRYRPATAGMWCYVFHWEVVVKYMRQQFLFPGFKALDKVFSLVLASTAPVVREVSDLHHWGQELAESC